MSHLHSLLPEWSLTDNRALFTTYASQCAEWKTERGRELLFTQMLMWTPLSRLRTVLGADQSICHRTDDAIHATTAAQGSLTTHSAKGPEGACVCVFVPVRALSQIQAVMTPRWFRSRGWRSVDGVMVIERDGWIGVCESPPLTLRPINQWIGLFFAARVCIVLVDFLTVNKSMKRSTRNWSIWCRWTVDGD